jgi:hypothetical protein
MLTRIPPSTRTNITATGRLILFYFILLISDALITVFIYQLQPYFEEMQETLPRFEDEFG